MKLYSLNKVSKSICAALRPSLNVRFQQIISQLHLLARLKGWHTQIWARGAPKRVTQITLQNNRRKNKNMRKLVRVGYLNDANWKLTLN